MSKQHIAFTIEDVTWMDDAQLDKIILAMQASQTARKANERLFFIENSINADYCVDFSISESKHGSRYVYAWVTKDNWLYIGQGKIDRIRQFHTNIPGLTEQGKSVKRYVFAKCISEWYSEKLERALIRYACVYGLKLLNRKTILSKIEIERYRKRLLGEEDSRRDYQYDDWYNEMIARMNAYENVFNKFEEFIKDVFGRDQECFKDDGNILYVNEEYTTSKSRDYKELNTWTIGGETKTITEWEKQYSISKSTVENRMKKFGLPLEKALKLPKMHTCSRYKTSMDYWKEMGLL